MVMATLRTPDLATVFGELFFTTTLGVELGTSDCPTVISGVGAADGASTGVSDSSGASVSFDIPVGVPVATGTTVGVAVALGDGEDESVAVGAPVSVVSGTLVSDASVGAGVSGVAVALGDEEDESVAVGAPVSVVSGTLVSDASVGAGVSVPARVSVPAGASVSAGASVLGASVASGASVPFGASVSSAGRADGAASSPGATAGASVFVLSFLFPPLSACWLVGAGAGTGASDFCNDRVVPRGQWSPTLQSYKTGSNVVRAHYVCRHRAKQVHGLTMLRV
jgi:hypothetical protein